jgi:hypothetical protein
VGEIKLFGGELHFFSGRLFEITSLSEQILEILSAKRDLFFFVWLSSHDLLQEVLEDAWEVVWYFDLFSGKDAHVFNVGHFEFKN